MDLQHLQDEHDCSDKNGEADVSDKNGEADVSALVCESDEQIEKEIAEMRAEIQEIADKIGAYRQTVPCLLNEKLESLIIAMRSAVPSSAVVISAKAATPEASSSEEASDILLGGEEEENEEREIAALLEVLKSKVAANVAAMPELLNKMKRCIEKMNSLEEFKNAAAADGFPDGLFGD